MFEYYKKYITGGKIKWRFVIGFTIIMVALTPIIAMLYITSMLAFGIFVLIVIGMAVLVS